MAGKKSCGGPKTEEGKRAASQNALQHGCTARVLLVGDESQEEFDAMRDHWHEEFPDQRQSNRFLLDQVIRAAWMVLRTERRYDQLEKAFENKPYVQWTEAEHQDMQLALRYKTTADRSFLRAFAALEGTRRGRALEQMAREKHAMGKQKVAEVREARERTERERARDDAGREAASTGPEPRHIKQYITVAKDENGDVKAIFAMPNATVKWRMENDPPEWKYVLRCIQPAEPELPGHEWLTSMFAVPWQDDNPTCYQRLTYEKWLEVIAREAPGQVGPTNEEEEEDWAVCEWEEEGEGFR